MHLSSGVPRQVLFVAKAQIPDTNFGNPSTICTLSDIGSGNQ
jgi:hypothetical protein